MMPNPTTIAADDEPRHRLLVLKDPNRTSGGAYFFSTQATPEPLGGGDMALPFFYLAGPMSNLPGFNFAEFHRIAKNLRNTDYNIVNPAQLDYEIERMVRENSEGSHRQLTEEMSKRGLHNPTWAECLIRDIQIVCHPNCEGVVVIPNWEKSQGAQFETYVAYKLRKPIYRYVEFDDHYDLERIDRREALQAVGVID